jgi:hypothetical protein
MLMCIELWCDNVVMCTVKISVITRFVNVVPVLYDVPGSGFVFIAV